MPVHAKSDRIVGMLASLTREEMRESEARLVVWPEVALPGYLFDHPEWRDPLRSLATIDSTLPGSCSTVVVPDAAVVRASSSRKSGFPAARSRMASGMSVPGVLERPASKTCSRPNRPWSPSRTC